MFRSKKCIFLEYSSNYQGYGCLDLATKRIYISRHVVFDENTFPTQDWIPSLQYPSASNSTTTGTISSLHNLVDGLHHSSPSTSSNPSPHLTITNYEANPADNAPFHSATTAQEITPATIVHTSTHSLALPTIQIDENSLSTSANTTSSPHDLPSSLHTTPTPTSSTKIENL